MAGTAQSSNEQADSQAGQGSVAGEEQSAFADAERRIENDNNKDEHAAAAPATATAIAEELDPIDAAVAQLATSGSQQDGVAAVAANTPTTPMRTTKKGIKKQQGKGKKKTVEHAHFQPSLANLAKSAESGEAGQSADGMQSLMAAIELDLTGQGGSFQDREREYLELMHTQFTEENHERVANNEEFDGEPVDYGLSQIAHANAQGLQTNDIPLNLQLPLLQQQHQRAFLYSQQAHAQHPRSRPSATATIPAPPINRKRKWPGFPPKWQDAGARLARIRQVITSHLPLLLKTEYGSRAPAPLNDNRLTTFSCSYAQIGQKSYGHEKRFLTPPPFCTISGRYGPLLGETPTAHMSVHADIGTQSILQTAELDENGHIYFKQLHINAGSVGKSKKFSLRLQIAAKGARHPANVPFADFDTDDVFIISKATKKTTKTRMQIPIIRHGGLIALYNRINSQTVRTKYLGEEFGSMIVKADNWAPFRIDMFEPGEPDAQGNIPIPYGSKVSLSNMQTGFVSEPLIVKRVENNLIEEQDMGYISQMQKLVFERWSPDLQTSSFQAQHHTGDHDASALDPSLEPDYGSNYVADPHPDESTAEDSGLLPQYTLSNSVNQFVQHDDKETTVDTSKEDANMTPAQPTQSSLAAQELAQNTAPLGATQYGDRYYLSASRAQRMSKELQGGQADPTTCWDHATLNEHGTPKGDDHLCWLVVGVTQFEFSFLDCLDMSDEGVPEPVAESLVVGAEADADQVVQKMAQTVAQHVEQEEQTDADKGMTGRRKRGKRDVAQPVMESPVKRRRRGKDADAVPEVPEAEMQPAQAEATEESLHEAKDQTTDGLPADEVVDVSLTRDSAEQLLQDAAEQPDLDPDFAAINGLLPPPQQQQLLQEQPSEIHLETAITPFPVLEARPSVLSNGRLLLLVNHFIQEGSHLPALEIWLGAVGPLAITRMTQDVTTSTQMMGQTSGLVALEVAMPSAEEMLHFRKVPLLFVRQDGLVYISGCEIVIQDGGHSVMEVEQL